MQRRKSHYVERIGFLIPSAFPYWFKGQIRAWKYTIESKVCGDTWPPHQSVLCWTFQSRLTGFAFAVIINSTLLERLSIFWSVAVVICAYLATRAWVGSGEESWGAASLLVRSSSGLCVDHAKFFFYSNLSISLWMFLGSLSCWNRLGAVKVKQH